MARRVCLSGQFDSRREKRCLRFGIQARLVDTCDPRQEDIHSDVRLGITINRDWSSTCTHLLMGTVEANSKLAMCLLDKRHVVSLSWLETIAQSPDKNFTFPVRAFTPPCSLDPLPNFEMEDSRNTVFAGSEFWFFESEQVNDTPMSSSAPLC